MRLMKVHNLVGNKVKKKKIMIKIILKLILIQILMKIYKLKVCRLLRGNLLVKMKVNNKIINKTT